MATKSPSCPPLAVDKSVRVTAEFLEVAKAAALVSDTGRGGIVTFSGCVRDSEEGTPIAAIDYEAYTEMAQRQLEHIAREARERWDAKVEVWHRTGRVPAGEASLVIAVATAHRAEAFEACRFIVDEIKIRVPVWKVGFEKESV